MAKFFDQRIRLKIGGYLNLITGLIETFCLLGVCNNFFYITNVMIDDGHFCPLYDDESTIPADANQSVNPNRIRPCQGQYDEQAARAAPMITAGLAVFNMLGLFYGFVLDRFNVLFVRILIIVAYTLGFILLSMVNFQSEGMIYAALIFLGLGTGFGMVQAIRDVPQAVPSIENIIRSIVMAMPQASGFFYWVIGTRLSNEARKTNANYFWTYVNFSYIMIGFTLIMGTFRTYFWLSGKYNDQHEYKRKNHHQFFKRRSVIGQENRSSVTNLWRRFSRIGINEEDQGVNAVAELTEDVGRRISRISARVSQVAIDVIGYKSDSDSSILDMFKSFNFWSHVGWMALSVLPFFAWISYMAPWLIEKGYSGPEIGDFFKPTGYLNLSSILIQFVHGLLVDKIAMNYGYKKAVCASMLFLGLLSVGTCFLSALANKENSSMVAQQAAYLLQQQGLGSAFTNSAMGIILICPPDIIGQGIGFNITVAGAVSFIPLAVYASNSSIKNFLMICGCLVGLACIFNTIMMYRYKQPERSVQYDREEG